MRVCECAFAQRCLGGDHTAASNKNLVLRAVTACTNEPSEIPAVCHAAARKNIAEAYARLVGVFDAYGIHLVY